MRHKRLFADPSDWEQKPETQRLRDLGYQVEVSRCGVTARHVRVGREQLQADELDTVFACVDRLSSERTGDRPDAGLAF